MLEIPTDLLPVACTVFSSKKYRVTFWFLSRAMVSVLSLLPSILTPFRVRLPLNPSTKRMVRVC